MSAAVIVRSQRTGPGRPRTLGARAVPAAPVGLAREVGRAAVALGAAIVWAALGLLVGG
jgi:hypothetical protein